MVQVIRNDDETAYLVEYKSEQGNAVIAESFNRDWAVEMAVKIPGKLAEETAKQMIGLKNDLADRLTSARVEL